MTSKTIILDPPDSELTSDIVNQSDPPLVSLCIPAYNNEDTIGRTLESFSSQNYPNIEIIVVDNGSTDQTRKIAEQYTEKVFVEKGPIGKVRQRTVKEADGNILGLFDSDIVFPTEDWLSNAVRYFNYDETVSTVWPENVAPPGSSPTTRLYFELWHVVERDRMEADRGPFGGGNALFRRDALEAVGGIDASLHYVEDLDWAVRLQEAGYKVVYIIEPIHHYTMLSFTEFARKQFMATEKFARAGGEVTGLPVSRLIYEQIILGTKGMIKGIVKEREPVWLLFPAFLLVRSIAFLKTTLTLFWERFRGTGPTD